MKEMTDTLMNTIKEMQADLSLLIELEEKRMKYENLWLKDEREYEETMRTQKENMKKEGKRLQIMQRLMGTVDGPQNAFTNRSYKSLLTGEGFRGKWTQH
jgi:hypothetical protein